MINCGGGMHVLKGFPSLFISHGVIPSLLADLWSHALTPSSCPNPSHWRSLSSPGVPSLTYTHMPLVSHIPIHSHTLTYTHMHLGVPSLIPLGSHIHLHCFTSLHIHVSLSTSLSPHTSHWC
ncbi:hypothetical protein ADUPG1_004896 [Aduncisulcus paluster]|uniref:Uncharacterized protein n=1 Tax=Aduncisulcus paluster TaxID=2918883 RepID=A0ABQ5K6W7_9EUKA|nr:hypothetical protein ADUPG1_004896 [Aduncisulcus paluster]